MTDQTDNSQDTKLVGLLAQFDDPSSLVHACEHARDAGFKKMDAFTPFPIHGIEKAIGIPRTILPFLVLAIGIGGCFGGLALQWYTNGTEQLLPFWSGYEYLISGKPLFSLPANIPVTFEVTVLSSAFAAFFGMWALNKLPRFANPLHRIPRFKRATDDRFFLMIESDDENFDLEQTRTMLNEQGASEIEEVREDLTDQQLPAFLRTVGVLGAVLLMLPPILIYRARGITVRETRLHVVQDMDFQYKYKAQQMGPVMNDSTRDPEYFYKTKRAAQHPVQGTVARGQLMDDPEFYHGIKAGSEEHASIDLHNPSQFVSTGVQEPEQDPTPDAAQGDEEAAAVVEPDWVTEIPGRVPVTQETIDRGERMYNIYCSVCHGYSGDGDGLVNQRALALALDAKAEWTEAKAFNDPEVVKQPVGRLFDTITNGRATMGPYGTRISPEDRWAIVLYVKVLQEIKKDVPYVAPGSEESGEGESDEGNAEAN